MCKFGIQKYLSSEGVMVCLSVPTTCIKLHDVCHPMNVVATNEAHSRVSLHYYNHRYTFHKSMLQPSTS